MRLIDGLELPPFSRTQWVSPKAREVWEPRVAEASKAYSKLERLTVQRKIRDCTTTHVRPESLDQEIQNLARQGLVFVPRVRVGVYQGFANCLREGTLVWTGDRFYPIELLAAGVELPDGPVEAVAHKFSRKLIRISPNMLPDLECTPEHQILIRRQNCKKGGNERLLPGPPEWVLASEIEEKADCVVVKKEILPQKVHTYDMSGYSLNKLSSLPDSLVLDKDLAFLFGIYNAEGWAGTWESKGQKSGTVEIALSETETDLADQVVKTFEQIFGIRAYVRPNGRGRSIKVQVCSAPVARFFIEVCGVGSDRKHVPYAIFSSPREVAETYFEAYMEGDGHQTKKTRAASSVSEQLARQHHQLLLHKLGIVSSFQKIHATSGFGSLKPTYRISWTLVTQRQFWIEDETSFYFPVRKITEIAGGPFPVWDIHAGGEYRVPFTVHNSHPPVEEGRPWSWYGPVSHSLDGAMSFIESEEKGDHEAIARLLGYPECCARMFTEVWMAGYKDPVWQYAAASEGAHYINDRTIELKDNNLAFTWFGSRYNGVRITPHLACSAECKKTEEISRSWVDLGNEEGIDGVSDLMNLMNLPTEWNCLHGIVWVTTPLYRVVSNSTASAEKYIVRKHGPFEPEEAQRGLVFPFRQS